MRQEFLNSLVPFKCSCQEPSTRFMYMEVICTGPQMIPGPKLILPQKVRNGVDLWIAYGWRYLLYYPSEEKISTSGIRATIKNVKQTAQNTKLMCRPGLLVDCINVLVRKQLTMRKLNSCGFDVFSRVLNFIVTDLCTSQSKPRPPPPPRDMWGFSGALSLHWQLFESPVCGGFVCF